MADETTHPEDEPVKRRLPIKMIIVIAIVMVVEGAVIGGGVMLFGDKKPAVANENLQDDSEAAKKDLVEVLLVGGKFQNTRQGAQAYMYDTSIYVVVRQQNQAYVESMIEAEGNRIRQEVSEVFGRAEPAELNDAERLSLKRKILAKCEQRFKKDAEGESYIHEVVFSGWMRISSDQ